MRKKEITVNQYSLLELIAVCAVIAVLLTAVLQFFYNGSKLTRRFYNASVVNQEALIVKARLRAFVHGNDGVFSASENIVVFRDKARISIKGSDLLLEDGKEKRTLKLPKNTKLQLAIEDRNTKSERVVLKITPFDRHGRGPTKSFIRIVARVDGDRSAVAAHQTPPATAESGRESEGRSAGEPHLPDSSAEMTEGKQPLP